MSFHFVQIEEINKITVFICIEYDYLWYFVD